ncbi:hypothetical protein BDN70DRAFT_881951 [Pholiota conissans]|uniref:N-acetyltransferase domain-containing protein n=1 Tax=Pholiota conissans TaxID=109636 RepID=A0A9P5YYD9_9AGAR|nr:hypothetical protein BDN70DRAFT_881951 [Pholiota conissans]
MASSSEAATYPLIKTFDTSATEAEIKQLANVLVEAFRTDPYGLILLGNDYTLAPGEFVAQVRATLINGALHAFAVGPALEDIVGVALWFPPGKRAFATEEEKVATGWHKVEEATPPALRAWRNDYFGPTVAKMVTDSIGIEYIEAAWHLRLFGVIPEHQGKGYGRALFDFAERQAKQTNSNLVVQTPTDVDVEIYKRFGFRICGETYLKSEYGDAHMRLMLKEAEGAKE